MGQIVSFMSLYISISIKNQRIKEIENADVWGNVVYPRIAANSYLGTFCEINLIYLYIVGMILIFFLDFCNLRKPKKDSISINKADIRLIFASKFIYGFFYVFITLSINMILTLLIIPNIPPEKISWEYIYARSDFMTNLYQNHPHIYVMICNLEISLFFGLLSDYTIVFNSMKKMTEIISRTLMAGVSLIYFIIGYSYPDWNLLFAFDPANRFSQGDKCWRILLVMIVIDFALVIIEYKKNNKSDIGENREASL